MRKRSMLFAIVNIVLVAALTACGSSSGTNNTPPAATPTPDVQNTAPAPEADLEKSLTGELVYWTMWNETEPQGEAWAATAKEFMEKYPETKITINWSGRDISKTLKPALESGQRIDIFDYPSQYGDQLGGYTMDLSNIITQQFEVLGDKSITDVILPSMLETPKSTTGIFEGQVALGYKPWLNLFMYNAKAFEEAGITSNPTTWAELDEASAKLLAAGYSPITFDDAYAHWISGTFLQRLKGQDWVVELANDKTGDMWRDPAVLEFAKAFEDFAQKGYFNENVGGNKWPSGQNDVGYGKVAMYFNLTGLPSEVKDIAGPDFKWGAFNYPDVTSENNFAANAAAAGATSIAVNNKVENPELAAEFLAFMYTQESDARFVDSGMTTALKDGQWPAALIDVQPVFADINVILQTGGGIESNPEIKPVFAENFIKLASKRITAEEFVNNMAAAAKQ